MVVVVIDWVGGRCKKTSQIWP